MIEIVKKEKCSGCSGCMNICPKDAIIMKEDEKGFKYPVIDQEKCIDCGMCKKVCPVLNNKKEDVKKLEVYACYNKDDVERLNSSSGGIFVLLAKVILKRNGVVFGAAFDNDFIVKHSFIEKEEDLKKFMGSKYTQSSIGDTYKKAKEFLESKRYVLFTGTPCQIEGLKSYLMKDYDNLYTQDIVCHGVPSPKVWKEYLEYRKNLSGENIKSVYFRNKDFSWSAYRMKILFEKSSYSKEHRNDLFMKVFLKDLCLRDSCYNCEFKKKYRESDITLADYWGIDKVYPEINDNKGVSLVVINSNKGKELFEIIKDNLNYMESDLNKALEYNKSMIKSAAVPNNREAFFNDLDKMDFDKLVNKYIPKKNIIMRILGKCKRILKKIINNI